MDKPYDLALLKAIEKQLGLDGPLHVRYYKWLVNLLQRKLWLFNTCWWWSSRTIYCESSYEYV